MGKKPSQQSQPSKKEEKPVKPETSEVPNSELAKEPIGPVVDPVKEKKDTSKESITAKNEALLGFLRTVSMKGSGSTSENNTVKDMLYDTVLVSLEEIEKKVKKGATEETVSFVKTRNKGIEANSICLVDMEYQFEGNISKKFNLFIDSVSDVIERLNAFKKEHDITIFRESGKLVLKDMQTGIKSWINNETKDYAAIKKKLEESDFNDTFGYKLVEKDGLKYLISEKQKVSSGFVVNASLFKQVFSHCSILKFYLIPIELHTDDKGKYLRLAIETDNGGFEKEFRDKKEITFFGPDKELTAMYGIGLDSICNITGNANLACTYATDKFMFIYTELDNCIIRMVVAPRIQEKPGNEDADEEEPGKEDSEKKEGDVDEEVSETTASSDGGEETDDLEAALKEATGKDPEDIAESEGEDDALDDVLK